ncbi:MAG: 50S ribosomal protein L19e [Candidatus Hadarchaeales archaeon]
MKLDKKRRTAARILGVGVNRVWIDPEHIAEVDAALTADDIRNLIKRGYIRARPEKGVSRGRVRERGKKKQGPGSRKGARGARDPRKRRWIRTVRPLRAKLRELKKQGVLTPSLYRRLYRMASRGAFKSKAHLDRYLREKGIIKG